MTLLTSSYFSPLAWYAPLARGEEVFIEQHDNFVKQTFRNRCIIAGPNGRQVLTIPVEKSIGKTPIREVRISEHGNWRHLHWNALESSYGKSPFFEYYADDLAPFYERHWNFLFDFNEASRQAMCRLLDIDSCVAYTSEYRAPQEGRLFAQEKQGLLSAIGGPDLYPETAVRDLRALAEPSLQEQQPCPPYYQVFSQRQGFIPNLSILDLLFNMGPEALLYLTQTSFL